MDASISIPAKFTRQGNTDHLGAVHTIADTRKFDYGTAGFRAIATELPFVIYRMGFLAGLRSKFLNKAIGLVITASHNPEKDNGIKIVDPMGEMLEMEWEKVASELVNCSVGLSEWVRIEKQVFVAFSKAFCYSDKSYGKMCNDLWKKFPPKSDSAGEVLCGYDTRPSSEYLSQVARCGVESAHCKFTLHGCLTTPQLHYIVRCFNDHSYGVPSEDGYYEKYSKAFNALLDVIDVPRNCFKRLLVDCANGVGALKLGKLLDRLKPGCIDYTLCNVNGVLNKQCGADYIKIEQTFPLGFEDAPKNVRFASLDGDADRLLYFYKNNDDRFVLLDGDKIATLFAKFFQEQLNGLGLLDKFSLALVQTAYANGSSMRFIRDKLGLNTRIVPTGVKHLHHEALKYDIGIYFEANGHGTVLFSENFKQFINKEVENEQIQVKRLRLLVNLINDVVGDAMSDLLAVEILLLYYGWSIEDWAHNLYKDVPSWQLKVKVKDRSLFKTIVDETKLTSPAWLQPAIDKAVSAYQSARSFVRPSGTEDIVRVYAEAETLDDARALAEAVEGLVKNACGDASVLN